MKSPVRIAFLIVLLVTATVAVPAQVFRIGSAAPENSPWGRTLNRLAAEWHEISDGRTLAANIELVKSNARLAARIEAAL